MKDDEMKPAEAVQQLSQVMNVLGMGANETRVECAQRVIDEVRLKEDEIVSLRIRLQRAQQDRDAAQVAQRGTEAILGAVFDQIYKLAEVPTAEARSPTEALRQQAAVWTEFERLRKQYRGEKP